ncbi:hypothetical protein C2S51_026912 [Perilla frutescens var. frutescens]|nr:hypothetical protein C2S51_026912 [Perilla frutescens var. frutescens]
MGVKLIGFLEFLLVIVLIISPQVAVSRKLAQTTNTINPLDSAVGSGNPNLPFCIRNKLYGKCIPQNPKNRKCNYKNKCQPPAQPEP